MNSIKIDLAQECGEFCTERSHPKLPWLREQIEKSLNMNYSIIFDRSRVKILTTSFVDEMISELALKYGLEEVEKHISFQPILDPLYRHQVKRGMFLRSNTRP